MLAGSQIWLQSVFVLHGQMQIRFGRPPVQKEVLMHA